MNRFDLENSKVNGILDEEFMMLAVLLYKTTFLGLFKLKLLLLEKVIL